MKVTEHIAQAKNTLISFEVLPPLKGKSITSIYDHLDPLMEFKPSWINVTYHRSETMFKKKSDGSFEISGEVPASHYAIIQTDSSQGDVIWLDAGTYTVDCRETTIPEVKSLLFRITTMNGPKDAELYNDFQNRIMYNYNLEGKRALTLRYVDSVFRYFPDAGPLSRIVAGAHYNLDDSVTEKYISMLPPEMKNSGDIEMLEGEIKRKAKIHKKNN